MKLFQNFFMVPSYEKFFYHQHGKLLSYSDYINMFLEDRYGSSHVLAPVDSRDASGFLALGSSSFMQKAWAQEQGMSPRTSLAEILLAQIEHHRTEVFYNFDPYNFDGTFAKRLPGSVRRKIAWRAAPGAINFEGYDLVLNNFPSIQESYRNAGIHTGQFFPAHDAELDSYAANSGRDIDIVFIGGYTRHHIARREVISTVAALSDRFRVHLHLDKSRYAGLARTPLGWFGPLAQVRVPNEIREFAQGPIFGREMYRQLSRARIVINVAIEMAGNERGNMRCFEAMGARSLLLTDDGNYPEGMVDLDTMVIYRGIEDMKQKIADILDQGAYADVADRGFASVRSIYSKKRQFRDFMEFC